MGFAGGSGLRDVQHLRCLGDVFALRDTDEYSELLQSHAAYIAYLDRYDQPFDMVIPIWISEWSAAFRLRWSRRLGALGGPATFDRP